MIKGSIYLEVVTFINLYAPNNKVPKYMKQKLSEFKAEKDKWKGNNCRFQYPTFNKR